jgi:hypothetical protein
MALAGVVTEVGVGVRAFVSTTTSGPEDAGRGVTAVRIFTRSDVTQLAELVARVETGDLKINVAERRPLTELAAVTRRPPPDGCRARPS